MATSNIQNPNGNRRYQDPDNQRQHQSRQAQERKHSAQSGSNAGRNNPSPAKGDRGQRHSDSKQHHMK